MNLDSILKAETFLANKALKLESTTGKKFQDFPVGPVVKNPPTNSGDTVSIRGLGRIRMPQGN